MPRRWLLCSALAPLLLSAGAAPAGAFDFATAYDIEPMAGTSSFVAADFNRDGLVDLAYVDAYASLYFRAGRSDGSFGDPVLVGPWYGSLQLVDLDGNGDPDLYGRSSNGMTFGIGLGNGMFHAVRAGSGTAPAAVTTDLDGDGLPDLVTALGGVQVYKGHGDGTFDAPVTLFNGIYSSVAVADVDHDGVPDVLVTAQTQPTGVQVWGRDGSNPFVLRRTVPMPNAYEIHVADLDRNGWPDIVASDPKDYPSSRLVSVSYGGPSGFSSYVAFDTGPQPSPTVRDVTGDGWPDIVVESRSGTVGGQASILVNDGAGNFGQALHTPAGIGFSLQVGDVNHDGRLDLMGAIANGGLSVLQGDGQGHFGHPEVEVPTSAYPEAIVAADFDGDHIMDLVTAHSAAPGVMLLHGTGGGAYEPRIPLGGLGPVTGLATGDLNHDGHPDLVVGEANTAPYQGRVLVMLGNGDGWFTVLPEIATGTLPWVGIADMNHDGVPDLVIAHHVDQFTIPEVHEIRLSVYMGRGDGTFAPPVNTVVGATNVQIADLDGNGIPDVVVPGLYVYLGHGDGTFISYRLDSGRGPENGPFAIGDLDGDGHPDLATIASNMVDVFMGNAAGQLSYRLSVSLYDLTGIAITDLDGDGYGDLVVCGRLARIVSGRDLASNPPVELFGAGGSLTSITAADVNGDEAADLLFTENGNSAIAVLLQQAIPPPSPVLTWFSPLSGLAGSTVTITGQQLGSITRVTFGGVAATFVSLDPQHLRATVPAAAHTGPIQVQGPHGFAISATDFVVLPPVVTLRSFQPTGGPAGTVVELRGSGLAYVTAVTLDTIPASFAVIADSVLRATVPAGAHTAPWSVFAAGLTVISDSSFVVGEVTTVGPSPTTVEARPFPNPAGAAIQMAVTLPVVGSLRVDVYDVSGARVRGIAAGPFARGSHVVVWDGRDEHGRRVRPGLYRLVATSGEWRRSGKVVVY